MKPCKAQAGAWPKQSEMGDSFAFLLGSFWVEARKIGAKEGKKGGYATSVNAIFRSERYAFLAPSLVEQFKSVNSCLLYIDSAVWVI